MKKRSGLRGRALLALLALLLVAGVVLAVDIGAVRADEDGIATQTQDEDPGEDDVPTAVDLQYVSAEAGMQPLLLTMMVGLALTALTGFMLLKRGRAREHLPPE